jgi:hypothetical protein
MTEARTRAPVQGKLDAAEVLGLAKKLRIGLWREFTGFERHLARVLYAAKSQKVNMPLRC